MTLTNNTIIILIGMLLMFLMLLLVTSVFKNSRSKQTSTPQPKQPHPTKQRHEEVVDTLDWMLQNQIITTSEYNQLMMKSLPYL